MKPLLLFLALAASCVHAARPNILFLFADDHCHEAVRTFGRTDIDTPNLDRLAARGTTFTRASNMGSWSGAVCVASRTMLITGRSVWDANKVYNKTDAERAAGVLWPQLMKKAGYQTYMTGKWHIQTDATKCFDVTRNVRAGMPKTMPASYNRPLEGAPDPWRPDDRSLGGFWEGGTHWSEVVANDTLGFFKEAQKSDKPFFIYAAFNAPHDPRQAPKEFLDRYPLERIAMPANFLPEYPHKDAIGCSHKLRDENLAPMPRTELAVKTHRREYYALITHLDQQIGRIRAVRTTPGSSSPPTTGSRWVIMVCSANRTSMNTVCASPYSSQGLAWQKARRSTRPSTCRMSWPRHWTSPVWRSRRMFSSTACARCWKAVRSRQATPPSMVPTSACSAPSPATAGS
jgi:choline-sulfatase